MKKYIPAGLAACLILLCGCATPAAVKEAAVALDQGFKDNLTMMEQYRTLVVQINERHRYWWQYTMRRDLLRSALMWATTDPRSTDLEVSDQDLVDDDLDYLGNDLVRIINRIRLKDLPAREGSTGIVFNQNTATPDDSLRGTVGGIIQALPALINAVNTKVDSDYNVRNDLSGFDAYKTNVEVLTRINATILRYLSVDPTVHPADVRVITNAVRQLQ